MRKDKIARKIARIPRLCFAAYWLLWASLASLSIVFDWQYMMWPLVIAFIVVEALGVFLSNHLEGTLTDITASSTPEDLTFVLIGLVFWRMSQWVTGWEVPALWATAFWLLQHFIRHYANESRRNAV